MKQALRKGITLLLSLCMAMCFATAVTAEEGQGHVIDVATPEQLANAMEKINEVDSNGRVVNPTVTVNITNDISFSAGDRWVSGYVNGYNGTKEITVNGNGHTFSNIGGALFGSTWAGGNTSLTIRDLTIADSTISGGEDGVLGFAAFVGNIDSTSRITIDNCHLKRTNVTGADWTGGFVGYATGYHDLRDGPVFTTVTISNCSISDDCSVEGAGAAGGIIGHSTGNTWTRVNIQNCLVENNQITCTDSRVGKNNKAGSVLGTVGAGKFENEEHPGGTYVNAFVRGNTVTSGETTINRIFGRMGSAGGELTISGGVYYDCTKQENIDGNELHADAKLNISGAYFKEDIANITVDGGSSDKKQALPGETVTVTVDEPQEYKPFFHWQVVSGDVSMENPAANQFSFTVKTGGEIALKAIYHELHFVERVDATTETPGNLGYYTCSHCEKWFWDKAATKEIANKKEVVIAKLPADTEGVKDTVVVPEEKQVDKTQTNSAEAIAAAENLQVDEEAVAVNGVEIAREIQKKPENMEQAKTELKAALGSEYSETDTILLVVKPYVEVTPKAAELEGGIQKVELEITMKYNLQATIPGKTTVDIPDKQGIPMDKEQIKADTVVTVTLPASFTTSNGVIVRHDATANGYGIQYYISIVDSQNVTFTVPAEHGFSPFTLMSNASVTVKLDGKDYTYTSLDVVNGTALPAPSKYNYAFKGWKFEGIENQHFNMTAELFEALLDKNAVVIGSSVFEGPLSEHPEIEEAKKNGTWGVDDNKPAATAKPAAAAAVTPVRSSSIPKTSDDSNLMLWVCLMGLAALGLGGALYLKKRGNK